MYICSGSDVAPKTQIGGGQSIFFLSCWQRKAQAIRHGKYLLDCSLARLLVCLQTPPPFPLQGQFRSYQHKLGALQEHRRIAYKKNRDNVIKNKKWSTNTNATNQCSTKKQKIKEEVGNSSSSSRSRNPCGSLFLSLSPPALSPLFSIDPISSKNIKP